MAAKVSPLNNIGSPDDITVVDAIRALAEVCDGAISNDGQGFNKFDRGEYGEIINKALSGELLTPREEKRIYSALKKYKKQLEKMGIEYHQIGQIPRPKELDCSQVAAQPPILPTPDDIKAEAMKILKNGDPIQAHVDLVKDRVRGGDKIARIVIISGYSTYLPPDDRLHLDVDGDPQGGKSLTVTTALETFPEENVLIYSEASPKSLYYLAQNDPERLKDAIIYVDDARKDHIPLLKTFRNEGAVTPRNLTVSDGAVLELIVKYRPAVLASSVTPLRDLEGQATSRAFLASISKPSPEEEKQVRAAIRQHVQMSAALKTKVDRERLICQTIARMLRDEGIRDVLIPFDAEEPKGADRRGVGQFQKLIKISAFINQHQRPVLELTDSRKFVLATYADLEMAAMVWFDFAEGQEFKITSEALELLALLPSDRPGKSAPTLVKETGKGQRSIERYLEDLYEAGIASRERMEARGAPWGYWCEEGMRNNVLSQTSEAGDSKQISVRITTDTFCREYLEGKSSDSLLDSYIKIFSNSDIEIKKMYRGENEIILKTEEDLKKSFSLYIFQKTCRKSEKEPLDGENLTTKENVANSLMAGDSGSGNSVNQTKSVAERSPEEIVLRKRTCIVCGTVWPHDLDIHHHNGFICAECHREGRTLDVKPKNKIKAGPNPRKGPVPKTVRFIRACGQIVAEDLRHPGNTRPYGPFSVDDVAVLPSLDALSLIDRHIAVESVDSNSMGGA